MVGDCDLFLESHLLTSRWISQQRVSAIPVEGGFAEAPVVPEARFRVSSFTPHSSFQQVTTTKNAHIVRQSQIY